MNFPSLITRRLSPHTLSVKLVGFGPLNNPTVRLNMHKPDNWRNPYPWVFGPDTGVWQPRPYGDNTGESLRMTGDLVTLLALYAIDYHPDLPATSLSVRPEWKHMCNHEPFLIQGYALLRGLKFNGERYKHFTKGPRQLEAYIYKFAGVICEMRHAKRDEEYKQRVDRAYSALPSRNVTGGGFDAGVV